RLIVHVERRFREEQEGRRDAEAGLRQTEDELNKAKETSQASKYLICTDEAFFSFVEPLDRQNNRIWAHEKPDCNGETNYLN
ncbi:hypothetical protein BpHYR1_000931, partial [Brachionus plicatilis]